MIRTALKESSVLLHLRGPAMSLNMWVPESRNGSTLREADDYCAHIDDKLDRNDGPEETTTPFHRRCQFQKEEGKRDAAKSRTHYRKELTKVHPFDRVHYPLLGKISHVSTQAPMDRHCAESTITQGQTLTGKKPF